MGTLRQSLTRGGAFLTTLLVLMSYTAAQDAMPSLTTLHSFTGGSDGIDPWASVVIGHAGMLYGTTTGGGSSSAGTVFSLTPPASPGGPWTEDVLYSFKGIGVGDGAGPFGGLATGSHRVLYGTTSAGGTSNAGTVFSLTPPASPVESWTETVLYSFTGDTDGRYPQAGLVVGSHGELYGTTLDGGSSACLCGTVFSLTPPASPGASWTENVLYSFKGGNGFLGPADGSIPQAGLAIGNGGVLYGTTEYGGTGSSCSPIGFGCGTVFSLTPPTSPGVAWTENLLYSFAGDSDGSSPLAGLTIGGGGVLYGTTQQGGDGSCSFGCGTVFSLTPPASPGAAWTENVLYSFMGGSDGYYPGGGLAIATSGALYGTTTSGGMTNDSCNGSNSTCGTVFALKPPSSPGGPWTEIVLHRFTATEGDNPVPGVTIGHAGALYGTTSAGGTGSCSFGGGTVFSLRP